MAHADAYENRGAMPPVIGVAIYQSHAFANTYGTLGYLVAIASIISMCILPRARYFQTLVLNCVLDLLPQSLLCVLKSEVHSALLMITIYR